MPHIGIDTAVFVWRSAQCTARMRLSAHGPAITRERHYSVEASSQIISDLSTLASYGSFSASSNNQ